MQHNVTTHVKCGEERHTVGLKDGKLFTECHTNRCALIREAWQSTHGRYTREFTYGAGRSVLPGKLKVLVPTDPFTKRWAPQHKKVRGKKHYLWPERKGLRWRRLCQKRAGEKLPSRWGADWKRLYYILRDEPTVPRYQGEVILPARILRIDSKRRLLITGDGQCFLWFESGRTRLLSD